MSEDGDWTPPTEAEMKVLQARRERSDRISKLMGDYLLKGYKMLGTCCHVCDTILLEDKHGVKYCVACQELDSDNVKDDPALSDEAALSQAAEHSQRASGHSSKNSTPGTEQPSTSYPRLPTAPLPADPRALLETDAAAARPDPVPRVRPADLASPDLTKNIRKPPSVLPTRPPRGVDDAPVQESCITRRREPWSRPPQAAADRVPTQTLDALYSKLQHATVELQETTDVRHSTDLCVMIRSCAEAIAAVQQVGHQWT